jgi:hypothetical protein
VGSTRTVRQAPSDRPPSTRRPSQTSSNQNSKPRRIEMKGQKEHEEHLTNTRDADRPPGRRGLSARHGQSKKTARPRRSTPPNHHWISQMVEAVETRVWGETNSNPQNHIENKGTKTSTKRPRKTQLRIFYTNQERFTRSSMPP